MINSVLRSDTRLGGRSVLIRDNGRPLMFIPDEILECVVFVGFNDGKHDVLCGTAFWISVPIRANFLQEHYLVTAKHVVDFAKANSKDKKVYLRFSSRFHVPSESRIDCDEWLSHPRDPGIDVAATPAFVGPRSVRYKCIPIDMFANNGVVVGKVIGVGSDVFITGLFHVHTGYNDNLPVVRVGNIAAMPQEKVKTALGDMDVYLIECRSIGGLSGSPVFVVPHSRVPRDSMEFFLLGLIHGHFDTSSLGIDSAEDVVDAIRGKPVNSTWV